MGQGDPGGQYQAGLRSDVSPPIFHIPRSAIPANPASSA